MFTLLIVYTFCTNYRINNCHSKSFLDPLPIKSLIKSLSSPLSHLILEIVNNSFITISIHNDLKHAIVISIIWKGNLNPESLSSYRSIYQLSIISKIIEKILFTQLSDYLIKINCLIHNRVLILIAMVQKQQF